MMVAVSEVETFSVESRTLTAEASFATFQSFSRESRTWAPPLMCNLRSNSDENRFFLLKSGLT